MRQRLDGWIKRGDTGYYSFQRFTTGLGYLERAERKGEDPLTYRAEYNWEGKHVVQPAKEFIKQGPKLVAAQAKARKNGHKVETVTGRGAKVKLNKQTKRPAKQMQAE